MEGSGIENSGKEFDLATKILISEHKLYTKSTIHYLVFRVGKTLVTAGFQTQM